MTMHERGDSDNSRSSSMASPTTTTIKDESTVNHHEIATLLLNLAASRTSAVAAAASEEKLTASKAADVAMDLSIYAKSGGGQKQQQCSAVSNGGSFPPGGGTNTAGSATGGSNPYSLFPLSSVPALPSSYLLQNLLIGKMQQQLTGSDRVSSSNGTPTSTHASVIKSPIKASPPPASSSSPSSPVASNVPLLSGQIVAQLNALLFSIHGLTDKCIEAKVEGQLAAIFTRLQEIVAMVQLSKKTMEEQQQQQQQEAVAAKEVANNTTKLANSSNRQLEDFHASLLNSTVAAANNKLHNKSGNSVGTLRGGPDTVAAPPQLEISPDGQLRVVNNTADQFSVATAVESSTLGHHNHGKGRRMPRDFGSAAAPQEKRLKLSTPDRQQAAAAPSSSGRRSSKGGKGIRNRVFCGDCPGCLKNDDCGQCRYCRDKTKFGGQNRLRQKCLHRRCQMDTHRRSSGAAAAAAGCGPVAAGPPEATAAAIYSGLELARLAAAGQQQQHDSGNSANSEDRQQPVFPKLLGGSSLTGPANSPEPEWSQTSHQSRIDKWKAKHEAMLKLAAAEGSGKSRSGTPSPADQRKLVIMSEKEEEEEEEDDDEELEEEDDDDEEEDENAKKLVDKFRKETTTTATSRPLTARSLNTALVV